MFSPSCCFWVTFSCSLVLIGLLVKIFILKRPEEPCPVTGIYQGVFGEIKQKPNAGLIVQIDEGLTYLDRQAFVLIDKTKRVIYSSVYSMYLHIEGIIYFVFGLAMLCELGYCSFCRDFWGKFL